MDPFSILLLLLLLVFEFVVERSFWNKLHTEGNILVEVSSSGLHERPPKYKFFVAARISWREKGKIWSRPLYFHLPSPPPPPLPRWRMHILSFVKSLLQTGLVASASAGNDVNDTRLNACWTGSARIRAPRPLESTSSKRNENAQKTRARLVIRVFFLRSFLFFFFLSQY